MAGAFLPLLPPGLDEFWAAPWRSLARMDFNVVWTRLGRLALGGGEVSPPSP